MVKIDGDWDWFDPAPVTYTFKGSSKVNKYLGESDVLGDVTNKIYGFGGDDVLQGGAFATNLIWGGAGDDTITGGLDVDRLYGEEGNDILNGYSGSDSRLYGGAGNDVLRASSSGSYLDGGAGADRMIGGNAADTFVIGSRADAIVETFEPEFDNQPNPRDVVRASITFTLASKLEDLVLTGLKEIDGSGNSAGNSIIGNVASNTLKGMGGGDVLVGGLGSDNLWGGAGKDLFVFNDVNDSKPTAAARDNIYDFTGNGGDRIDLGKIDANSKVAGNQAFTFIGIGGFHGKAGELRYDKKTSDTYIYADVNGDKKVDFSIHLDDAVTMLKGYFVL